MVDCLTKMIYYKPIKVMFNSLDLVKIIICMVIRYHSMLELIVMV